MSENKEELLEALNIIKEMCEETSCEECPLRTNSDECYLKCHTPHTWYIKDCEEPWRAFKD